MQGDKKNKIMKQRIDYIDRMKGMAIFLVVMGHVSGMAFRSLMMLCIELLVLFTCLCSCS